MVFQNNVVVFSFIFFLNAMREQQLFAFKETKKKKFGFNRKHSTIKFV